MHVLAIYAVNQHIADLMAEAADARLVRGARPTRGRFHFLTSRHDHSSTTAPLLARQAARS